jgi:hypothetical protein
MTGARMSTLATLRGSIARIESDADVGAPGRVAFRAALGHAAADAALQGGLVLGAVHEVFAEGRQSAAATGFVAGLARRLGGRRPLLWVRQDFAEIESAPRGDGARARRGDRAADIGRRAGLRCARRRRHGDLGRGASVRSRRQPQADPGGADVGSHRPAAARGGGAAALHGGNTMDRARGAFAAGHGMVQQGWAGVGCASARHPTDSKSSWPDRPMDHGMEL